LKLRVTAISHLPPLIFRPKPLGPLDVRVLPLLRSAGEQDHQLVAVATKIEPIPGPPIDPLLLHASTHALDVREITKAEPLDCNRHFRCGMTIKRVEPIRKRRTAVFLLVQQHAYHMDIGNTYVTYVAKPFGARLLLLQLDDGSCP